MGSHRTTARSVFLVVLGLAAGAIAQPTGAMTRPLDDAPPWSRVPVPPAPAPVPAPKPKQKPRMVFPIVGPVTYTNDFGAPRSQGRHEGNDIIAPKRSLAVAAEDGTVALRSGGAGGCYLYLYGKSKTTYLYIHLNNDLTKGNDNRGKCVPGVAYAAGLKTGAKVKAGEPVGFVGDSGDANGIASHLHFEVHPNGGAAVSPYPFLNRAVRLLFAADRGKTVSLALTGKIVKTTADRVQVKVTSLRSYPGGYAFAGVNRTVAVALDADSYVQRGANGAAQAVNILPLSSLKRGLAVKLWTTPAPSTLDAQMGKDGALVVSRVQIP